MAINDGFHFPEESVAFLGALKANNNRSWFAQNKGLYERAIKQPAETFCDLMTADLSALTSRPHGSKIFRLHRDLRFSKDKTPYNAHLHIAFFPIDKASFRPAWFFGLDCNRLVLGAGAFSFDKAILDAYRALIVGDEGAIFCKALANLEGQGVRLSEPELKRVPRDHNPDHPRAEFLRRKGLTAWVEFGDTSPASGRDAVKTCVKTFRRLKPVFDGLSKLAV